MKDIVIPRGNEEELIERAKLLGFQELWFIYDDKKKFYTPQPARLRIENLLIAKKQHPGKSIVKAARENIRKAIEQWKPTILYGEEELFRNDGLHQRSSGLNQVLCKLATQNKVTICFSLAALLEGTRRAQLLGRISQNIMLCQKFNTTMTIASFAQDPDGMRAPHDMKALVLSLGMHEATAKKLSQ